MDFLFSIFADVNVMEQILKILEAALPDAGAQESMIVQNFLYLLLPVFQITTDRKKPLCYFLYNFFIAKTFLFEFSIFHNDYGGISLQFSGKFQFASLDFPSLNQIIIRLIHQLDFFLLGLGIRPPAIFSFDLSFPFRW
ncbi:hypothetical protein ES703_100244 [subsurface metagenome]